MEDEFKFDNDSPSKSLLEVENSLVFDQTEQKVNLGDHSSFDFDNSGKLENPKPKAFQGQRHAPAVLQRPKPKNATVNVPRLEKKMPSIGIRLPGTPKPGHQSGMKPDGKSRPSFSKNRDPKRLESVPSIQREPRNLTLQDKKPIIPAKLGGPSRGGTELARSGTPRVIRSHSSDTTVFKKPQKPAPRPEFHQQGESSLSNQHETDTYPFLF